MWMPDLETGQGLFAGNCLMVIEPPNPAAPGLNFAFRALRAMAADLAAMCLNDVDQLAQHRLAAGQVLDEALVQPVTFGPGSHLLHFRKVDGARVKERLILIERRHWQNEYDVEPGAVPLRERGLDCIEPAHHRLAIEIGDDSGNAMREEAPSDLGDRQMAFIGVDMPLDKAGNGDAPPSIEDLRLLPN